MQFQLSFNVNEQIYLRNPESTELGKDIIKHAIELINLIGFETFTFKKLAQEMGTTEASIYRYFENKHRLLLYILNWYWSYMEFLVMLKLQNVSDCKQKLITIIELLTDEKHYTTGGHDYNIQNLHHIVIAEGSKAYLVKEVDEINKTQVFKPFKDLSGIIADIIIAYKKDYKYPYSLSSTIIETAHDQIYFAAHLPRLTDVKQTKSKNFVQEYLLDTVFRILD
jgi:AcrR family transcriptional regulator